MPGQRTDVLVVGGGPAGATAAFQLATAGLQVLLVDRAIFPRDKTCGESLSPGALGRLRAIGMWTPRADPSPAFTIPPGLSAPVRGMRIRSPRGTTFIGRYKSGPSGPGLAIRRTLLDDELLKSARARGVQVMQGMEAAFAEQTANGNAIVHVRATEGTTRTQIEAKRVVVADGRQSFLARELGFIEKQDGLHGRHRYAIRAHCENVSDLSDLAEMHVGEGGYCGIAPLSKTSANICYVLFTDRLDMAPRTIEADFRRHLLAFPDIARRLEPARVQGEIRVAGPLRLTSKRQSRGPFIACGDTTGFLDPFTGEGIAHAIACGVSGAEAVATSLAGRTGSFHDYEREIRALRRVKGIAALLLYGLVSRRALANSAASLFARMPRLGDAVVQLFGDQI